MARSFESIVRHIEAPPSIVWALVADTNRFDRAAGLTPGSYSYEELRPGDASSREQVASARQLGLAIRWIEPPYEWMEGRFVEGKRRFLTGPINTGGFSVKLVPEGVGTRVEAEAWIDGSGFLAWVVGRVMKGKFKRALANYLDSMTELLSRKGLTNSSTEPPAAIARRALVNSDYNEVASGSRTPVDESTFTHRSKRFMDAPIPLSIRDKLLTFLRDRPDEEVGQIRPFELATAWQEDRREVLRAFLHAARFGLVELRWQLNCPTCRVGSESASTLGDVGRTAHCNACQIDYDLDFAEHVEAIFKVSSAIRAVESALYCASSPWFRPHVVAQVAVEAGENRPLLAPLPTGGLLLRTLRGKARRCAVEVEKPPAKIVVKILADGINLDAEGEVEPGQETQITLENHTQEANVILLERTGWHADVVLGSVIATLPDFLDLFATEAPATGIELTVGTMTLLFSDLTGSTAMYERLGDARAYAVVGEHFRDMTMDVARNGGAIVKTMGDAVMASFSSPADALRAALDMVASCERAHGAIGLTVKLGLHEGPCLAVRANDRLDFFGTTVNVAARLQAKAEPSEVVIAEDLLQHPDVQALIHARGLPMRRFESTLKGIRETQKLIGLNGHGVSHSSLLGPK